MIYVFWGALLIAAPILASGATSECPTPLNAQDVLKCATEKSLTIQRVLVNEKIIETGLTNTAWYANPELEVSTVDKETEISLSQSLDLGGTRKAQMKRAQAELLEAKLQSRDVISEVKIETLIKLHRLRQIGIEKEVAAGIANALQKSISYLKSRPALSPEQIVSLSLFQLALADSKLKDSETSEEENQLEKFFLLLSDFSLDVVKKALPKLPDSFPDISVSSGETKTNAYLKYEALKNISMAELSAERANAWPELNIGPVAKFDKSNGNNEKAIGLKLSFELPFFNKNRDGVATATASLTESHLLQKLALKEESTERSNLVRSYKNALEALKEVPTLPEVAKIIERNESFEKRGLVSSALLVETYRQQLEIIKGRHGRELTALESLFKINKIDGKNIEEHL